MNLQFVIYISKATRTLSPGEVEQIAAASAEKNKNANLTGLLLQIGNYFVQVLEGEADALAALLKKIERDERHNGIRVIYQASTKSTMFKEWNMGYFDIENYYHANRLDVLRLRQYTETLFDNHSTSKEAIVQMIRSMPKVMKSWQNEQPQKAMEFVW